MISGLPFMLSQNDHNFYSALFVAKEGYFSVLIRIKWINLNKLIENERAFSVDNSKRVLKQTQTMTWFIAYKLYLIHWQFVDIASSMGGIVSPKKSIIHDIALNLIITTIIMQPFPSVPLFAFVVSDPSINVLYIWVKHQHLQQQPFCNPELPPHLQEEVKKVNQLNLISFLNQLVKRLFMNYEK